MTAEVAISSARTGIRGIGETTNFYKVGLAKKVLVLIHGIIGDTEGIAVRQKKAGRLWQRLIGEQKVLGKGDVGIFPNGVVGDSAWSC